MAAHSAAAHRAGVSYEVVEALRRGEPLPDPRLHALSVFTSTVNHLAATEVDAAFREFAWEKPKVTWTAAAVA